MTDYTALVDRLASQLTGNQSDLDENLSYYDGTYRVKAVGIGVPEEMRVLLALNDWMRVYLDGIDNRLDVEGFRMAGESKADSRLWDWWQANDLDNEAPLGHLESMMHGRAYITVAAPDPSDRLVDQNSPLIRVESPKNLWINEDPRTRRPIEGVRLYSSTDATLLLPDETVLMQRDGETGPWRAVEVIEHRLGVLPVVPLYNRQKLSHRRGRSEMTPAMRSLVDAASRLMMNLQATAELMAVPQRLLFGVARDALAENPDDPGATLEAYMARIMAFEDKDAHAFQWAAAELRNFVDGIQELTKQMASFTGLPPEYFSIAKDNPASADAIRMAETRLVKLAERKARVFGAAWEQAMRVAMLVMDGEIPANAHRMETIWRDPSTPTFSTKADAIVKLATAKTADGQPLVSANRARIDLGYSVEERRDIERDLERGPSGRLRALYGQSDQESQRQSPAAEGEVS